MDQPIRAGAGTAPLSPLRRLRALVMLLTIALVASGMTMALAGSAQRRHHAGRLGGRERAATSAPPSPRASSATAPYTTILNREFNMVTAENEMKWDATEPHRGQFNYSHGDRIVNHALQQRHAGARPHPGSGTPSSPAGRRACRGSALRNAMINHVTQVATHYRGQDLRLGRGERGVRRRQQRRPARLEPAAHRQRLDRGRVPRRPRRRPGRQALLQRLQHRRLINAKTHRRLQHGPRLQVPRRADRLRRLPVPLRRNAVPSNYQANLQRFAALGVDVQITELDIARAATRPTSTPPSPAPAWPSPAAPASPSGASATATPGAAGDNPLLFDGTGNKKAAYTSVLNALNGGSDPDHPARRARSTPAPGTCWSTATAARRSTCTTWPPTTAPGSPVVPQRRQPAAVAVRRLRQRLLPAQVPALRQGPRRLPTTPPPTAAPSCSGPTTTAPTSSSGSPTDRRLRTADQPQQRQGRSRCRAPPPPTAATSSSTPTGTAPTSSGSWSASASRQATAMWCDPVARDGVTASSSASPVRGSPAGPPGRCRPPGQIGTGASATHHDRSRR